MNYKKLIIDVIGITITCSTIFFFLILILYTHNDIKDALNNTFTLTMYFFTAIATLGSLLSVIYSIHKNSLSSIPRFRIGCSSQFIDSFQDPLDLPRKKILYNLRIMNIGEPAYFFNFSINLKYPDPTKKLRCVSSLGSPYSQDIFNNILNVHKQKALDFYVYATCLEKDDIEKVFYKNPIILTLKYYDKLHNSHTEIIEIKCVSEKIPSIYILEHTTKPCIDPRIS